MRIYVVTYGELWHAGWEIKLASRSVGEYGQDAGSLLVKTASGETDRQTVRQTDRQTTH